MTTSEPDNVVYVRNAPDGQKPLTNGIVSLCLFWLPVVNIIFGILAIIHGLDGLKSEDHDVRTKSRVGLICGAIGGFWWLALFIVFVIVGVVTG